MAEIQHYQKSVPSKIEATWPVTILTRKGVIRGKSKAITDEGIFVYCGKSLPRNEICKMVIKPASSLSVEVMGKFSYSNLPRTYYGRSSIKSLSFVKISDKYRHILNELMLLVKGKGMETVRRVKVRLHLRTDKRNLVRDFENLNDLRLFMQDFFSRPEVVDRRAGESIFLYSGTERRVQI
jgi:hypothetical protein